MTWNPWTWDSKGNDPGHGRPGRRGGAPAPQDEARPLPRLRAAIAAWIACRDMEAEGVECRLLLPRGPHEVTFAEFRTPPGCGAPLAVAAIRPSAEHLDLVELSRTVAVSLDGALDEACREARRRRRRPRRGRRP